VEAFMTRFILHWFVVAVSLAAAAYILPGVRVDTTEALLVGSLVLGLVNALVRPVLTVLTLPLTVLTLGLFYLVVNGVAFALAAYIVPGFSVADTPAAILGALLVSVVSWFAGQLFYATPEEPAIRS
jgi:putative membrane protein